MKDKLLYDYEIEEAEALKASEPEEKPKKDRLSKPAIIVLSVIGAIAVLSWLIFMLRPWQWGKNNIKITFAEEQFSYKMPKKYQEFTKSEYDHILIKHATEYDEGEPKYDFLKGLAVIEGTKIFHNEDYTMYIVVRHPSHILSLSNEYSYKYNNPTGQIGNYKYYKDVAKGWFNNYYFTNGVYETLITVFDQGCDISEMDATIKDIIKSYKMPKLAASEEYIIETKNVKITIPERFYFEPYSTRYARDYFGYDEESIADAEPEYYSKYDNFILPIETQIYYSLVKETEFYKDETLYERLKRRRTLHFTKKPFDIENHAEITITYDEYPENPYYYDIDEPYYYDEEREEDVIYVPDGNYGQSRIVEWENLDSYVIENVLGWGAKYSNFEIQYFDEEVPTCRIMYDISEDDLIDPYDSHERKGMIILVKDSEEKYIMMNCEYVTADDEQALRKLLTDITTSK